MSSPPVLDLARPALAAARAEIQRNGRALHTAQYVRRGDLLLTLFFDFGSPDTKGRMLELLGRAGRAVDADLVLLTTDVFMRSVLIPEGTAPEQVLAEEEAEGVAPSDDPEATEALVVQGITAAGVGWQVVQEYHRGDGGSIAFDEPVEQVALPGIVAVTLSTGLRGRQGAPRPVLQRVLAHMTALGRPPMVMSHTAEVEGMLR